MRLVFGAIVSFVLLGLYATSVIVGIAIVMKDHDPANSGVADKAFTDGMRLAMSTIGGLVSTLVVTVLASTTPGNSPVATMSGQQTGEIKYENLINYAIIAYIVLWILSGLSSFIVGVMMYPNVLQPLTNHGSTWLGIAVSAAYAFFGIKAVNR